MRTIIDTSENTVVHQEIFIIQNWFRANFSDIGMIAGICVNYAMCLLIDIEMYQLGHL